MSNRYEEASEAARYLLENFDEIDLAEMLASARDENARLTAEQVKNEAATPTAALRASRCDDCQHARAGRLRYGACLVDGCTCGRYQPTP